MPFARPRQFCFEPYRPCRTTSGPAEADFGEGNDSDASWRGEREEGEEEKERVRERREDGLRVVRTILSDWNEDEDELKRFIRGLSGMSSASNSGEFVRARPSIIKHTPPLLLAVITPTRHVQE